MVCGHTASGSGEQERRQPTAERRYSRRACGGDACHISMTHTRAPRPRRPGSSLRVPRKAVPASDGVSHVSGPMKTHQATHSGVHSLRAQTCVKICVCRVVRESRPSLTPRKDPEDPAHVSGRVFVSGSGRDTAGQGWGCSAGQGARGPERMGASPRPSDWTTRQMETD